MKIKINDQIFDVIIANTFLKKLKGLMFQKNIKQGMLFPNTRSIHTFFMKEKIDVIMINNNNQIVYYQKNLNKNKIIIKKEAHTTIELPKNSLKQINNKDDVIFL